MVNRILARRMAKKISWL